MNVLLAGGNEWSERDAGKGGRGRMAVGWTPTKREMKMWRKRGISVSAAAVVDLFVGSSAMAVVCGI